MPLSQCNDIWFKNINMDCGTFFDVRGSEKYKLLNFSYDNVDVQDHAKVKAFSENPIENLRLKNVTVNGEKMEW